MSVTTNWHVITGAPASGKTTLVKELENLGYRVIHEVARAIIESKIQHGITAEQARADSRTFERDILKAKIDIEAKLPKNETIIFDRAIPDSIAYFKLAGLNPEEAIAKSPVNHYKKIFFLDPLPYRKDHARIEEKQIAAQLDKELKRSYTTLGYKLIRIGAMPIERRLELVLKRIEDSKAKKRFFDDS